MPDDVVSAADTVAEDSRPSFSTISPSSYGEPGVLDRLDVDAVTEDSRLASCGTSGSSPPVFARMKADPIAEGSRLAYSTSSPSSSSEPDVLARFSALSSSALGPGTGLFLLAGDLGA